MDGQTATAKSTRLLILSKIIYLTDLAFLCTNTVYPFPMVAGYKKPFKHAEN